MIEGVRGQHNERAEKQAQFNMVINQASEVGGRWRERGDQPSSKKTDLKIVK